MARLRIRVELNRGGVGVPLHKLASVVDEAQKFFHMLADDVRIEKGRGEWLGFDFDHESLNFTAEYVGPVTSEQVQDFYAAFDGTTSLRRGTIDQFARITSAIGEDELIGFGLYQGEDGAEPSEWRCLSRRDALRIADEIHLLSEANAEPGDRESHLPAVIDSAMGARLFGEKRERDSGRPEISREVEADLYKRLTRVENRVEEHSGLLRDIRSEAAAAEDSFRNLLTAVEGFCDQATRQIERVAPLALAAPPPPRPFARIWPITAAIVAGIVLVYAGVRLWPTRTAQSFEQKVTAASRAVPTPAPVLAQPTPVPAPPVPVKMHVELKATEPAWISFADVDGKKLMAGLLVPGEPRTFELEKAATLRTGDAGGIVVRLDGKPLGPIGPRGNVREIEFKDRSFKVSTIP
jgi:hypothetical protein